MPGASRWSCRISEWVRGRVPPPGPPRRLCIGVPGPCLSRSLSLCLSGSWTASRKAAAPSPVPCCLHAGYPTPSPSPQTLSWDSCHWIISLVSPPPLVVTVVPIFPSSLLATSSVHPVFFQLYLEKESREEAQSSDNTNPSASSSKAHTYPLLTAPPPLLPPHPLNLTHELLSYMTSHS